MFEKDAAGASPWGGSDRAEVCCQLRIGAGQIVTQACPGVCNRRNDVCTESKFKQRTVRVRAVILRFRSGPGHHAKMFVRELYAWTICWAYTN
jgi:hypothetical protein